MGASRLVKNMEQASGEDVSKFQTAVGELIWMNTRTRLDIAFATSILSSYVSNPSPEHFQALKKLYRYLLRAKLALKYMSRVNMSLDDKSCARPTSFHQNVYIEGFPLSLKGQAEKLEENRHPFNYSTRDCIYPFDRL